MNHQSQTFQGVASVNGTVTSASEAHVALSDRGFLFGDGIFETFAAHKGKIAFFKEHMERLRFSAEAMHMDIPWQDETILFELQTLVDQLATPKAQVRLMVTRGNSWTMKSNEELKPNRYILAFPAEPVAERILREGLKLKRKLSPDAPKGAHAKVLSYQKTVVALNEAAREGYDDILWTNAANEVTESSTSNIFFVGRDGDKFEVRTPPESSGILMGITRQKILEVFAKSNLDIREEIIYADELPRFDEAFCCSSVRGLVPVSQIDKHKLHTLHHKSLYVHMKQAFIETLQKTYGVDFSN